MWHQNNHRAAGPSAFKCLGKRQNNKGIQMFPCEEMNVESDAS